MGLGLLSGRAAPPFLFSWGGAPARVIGRRAGRGLAPGGVACASVGGLLFAFARVAGRA